MISESKRRADKKWREKAYDRISIQVPVGLRDRWKAAASDCGLSLRQLIVTAVEKFLQSGGGSNG